MYQAEGESLYIRYNTDANVVNGLKNSSSYKPTGEKKFRNRQSLRRENQS